MFFAPAGTPGRRFIAPARCYLTPRLSLTPPAALREDAHTLDKTVDALSAGQEQEVIFDNVQLKKDDHKLTATVDTRDAGSESKDDNNELKVSVRCQG